MSRATDRLVERDYSLSLALNRLSGRATVCRLFRTVSQIGDGAIWYWIILGLPLLFEMNGLEAALTLALAASSGLLVYKAIKTVFRRPRPFNKHPNIKAAAIALDEWSFPSGHTLHATAFAIILLHYLPVIGLAFLPFALLTALSRVILGLHYPSDVIFGASIGALLAKGALLVSALIWAT